MDKLQNLGVVYYGLYNKDIIVDDSNNTHGSVYLMTTTKSAARELMDFKMFVLYGSGQIFPIKMTLSDNSYIQISREPNKWFITCSPGAIGELTLVRIR